jgi:hypothetical protein
MQLRRWLRKDGTRVVFATGCWIGLWTWFNLQLLHSLSLFV